MNLLQEILGIGQHHQAQPQQQSRQQQTMTPYANPLQAQLSMQQGQGFIPYRDAQAAQQTLPQQGQQLQVQPNGFHGNLGIPYGGVQRPGDQYNPQQQNWNNQ